MSAIRHGAIVIGVDETALAGRAVRWGAQQAALEGRRVVLVHAVRPVTAGRGVPAMDVLPDTYTAVRRYGEQLVARARDQVRHVAPDVEVDQVVEVSDPRTLILHVAQHAHLVVLGSHGRGPALSHLLGSVGVGVIRRATCPVVVLRPIPHDRGRGGVVVAVDANEEASIVLEHAFHQASLRGLPLRVLHYVMDPREALVSAATVGDVSGVIELDDLAVSEAMAGLRERYPDVSVSVHSPLGLPDLDLAQASSHADLLVVGNHQRGLLGRLLSASVATATLEHATCAVAVVPLPGGGPSAGV